MATKVCQEGHDGRLRHKHSQKGRAQGAGDHLNLHLHRVQQSSSRSRCAPPRTVLARRLRQAQDAGLHTHALLHGRQSTRLCRLPVAHAGAATFGALTHIHARAHTHAHVHTHVHLILAPWEFATHMRTWYWPPGSLPHTCAPGTGPQGVCHIHARAHVHTHAHLVLVPWELAPSRTYMHMHTHACTVVHTHAHLVLAPWELAPAANWKRHGAGVLAWPAVQHGGRSSSKVGGHSGAAQARNAQAAGRGGL